MAANNPWTREQTIIALNLYCRIPFNKVSSNHPEIIRIAKIIGRTPNSLKMKIGNFGSFDPELKKRGIVGLVNVSSLDKSVWEEFNSQWENLSYKSQVLISQLTNTPIEVVSNISTDDIPIGIDRDTIIKRRVNQSFFRSTILTSYNTTCCITGITIPELLVAAHIVPWSKDERNRLNPQNGLCLNKIHEHAFDEGFFTITTDYTLKLSEKLEMYKTEQFVEDLFYRYNNNKITLPNRFLPSKEFLEYHNNIIFKG